MNREPQKTIGIVSGIGPLAGADVLTKMLANAAAIYGAKEDDQYPDTILISHGIAGVDNTAALSTVFKSEIIRMVHKTEDAGATIIGMACNTAHVYLQDIQLKETTTLINLPEIVAQAAKDAGRSRHLLLTSSASRDIKLYDIPLTSMGVSYDLANDTLQVKLDEIIDLIMAYKLNQAGTIMQDVLNWAKNNDYDSVIAACTELPIAISHANKSFDLEVIDSSSELGKAMLRAYYSE